MADEGVYGENVGIGGLDDERGVREETVETHPQPTGDAAANGDAVDAVDAADDVRTRGAEAIEGSEGGTEDDLDAVRRGAAQDAGSGGMGRAGVPRNREAPEGEFPRDEDDDATTPG